MSYNNLIQRKPIRKELTIKASISEVWKALTSPEMIKDYMYGTTVISDWKEGSSIRFTGAWEGKPYEDKGTILTCREQEVLEYSYWSSFTGIEDVPENYAIIRFELTSVDGETLLVLTQHNSPTDAMHENSDKGWGDVLDLFVKVVEKSNGQ